MRVVEHVVAVVVGANLAHELRVSRDGLLAHPIRSEHATEANEPLRRNVQPVGLVQPSRNALGSPKKLPGATITPSSATPRSMSGKDVRSATVPQPAEQAGLGRRDPAEPGGVGCDESLDFGALSRLLAAGTVEQTVGAPERALAPGPSRSAGPCPPRSAPPRPAGSASSAGRSSHPARVQPTPQHFVALEQVITFAPRWRAVVAGRTSSRYASSIKSVHVSFGQREGNGADRRVVATSCRSGCGDSSSRPVRVAGLVRAAITSGSSGEARVEATLEAVHARSRPRSAPRQSGS